VALLHRVLVLLVGRAAAAARSHELASGVGRNGVGRRPWTAAGEGDGGGG
jgi:hypothetical protein